MANALANRPPYLFGEFLVSRIGPYRHLAAGHVVVATGRNPDAVANAVGETDDLLVVKPDITSLASAEAAVQAASDRFGRIDVLVNNTARRLDARIPSSFSSRRLTLARGLALDRRPSELRV